MINPARITMETYTRLWDQLPADVRTQLAGRGLSPDSLGWRDRAPGVDLWVLVAAALAAGGLGYWIGRR